MAKKTEEIEVSGIEGIRVSIEAPETSEFGFVSMKRAVEPVKALQIIHIMLGTRKPAEPEITGIVVSGRPKKEKATGRKAKLEPEDFQRMKNQINARVDSQAIADDFGVSISYVYTLKAKMKKDGELTEEQGKNDNEVAAEGSEEAET